MRSSSRFTFPAAAIAAALTALAAPTVALASVPGSATGAFKDTRALWMSRFEFTSESQIRSRVAAVADAGFTDLYFQVRGQGDVLYPSAIESWDNKYGGGFGPFAGPGFDPLGVALDAAADHGLDVHAWLNTVPMWRDTSSPYNPPSNPNHFYNARPDLRLKDANGNDMPLSSGQYVGVNPTHPDTVTHIADLAEELVTNYGSQGLDGVHLDYIRMVTSGSSGPLTYPQDPATRARFTSETGLNPDVFSGAYKNWVGDKITVLVESVRDRIKGVDANAELTAAVWRDFNIGGSQYQQFADQWVERGSLDTAFPMVYTADDALFRDNVLKYKALDEQAGVAIGLGSYIHADPSRGGGGSAQTVDQLDTAQYLGANGFNIFSYGTLFSGSSLNSFGQVVKAYNEELAARPDDNLPITTFEDGDAGFFGFAPTTSGSNLGIDNATTAALTQDTAYEGDASQQIDVVASGSGDWFLRHLAGSSSGLANPAGNRELIADGYLGFWLRTLDAGLSVQVAVDDVEGTGERGVAQDIIADGNWHLYEWNLDDDNQWEGWVNGNGQINGQTITLDSIQFFGNGDATIWLDAVMFDPFDTLGTALTIALAGDFDGDGLVAQGDLNLVLNNWGTLRGDWSNADGFASANVDQEELNAVLNNWGGTNSPNFNGAPIPEPASAVALLALALAGGQRPRVRAATIARAGGR